MRIYTFTKPGGISVSEASYKHLPMVFVDAVAGCEAYNMRFFMNRGVAVTAATRELAATTAALLSDDAARTRMTERFRNDRCLRRRSASYNM